MAIDTSSIGELGFMGACAVAGGYLAGLKNGKRAVEEVRTAVRAEGERLRIYFDKSLVELRARVSAIEVKIWGNTRRWFTADEQPERKDEHE